MAARFKLQNVTLAEASSLVAALLAILAIAGWAFGYPELASYSRAWPRMMPMTGAIVLLAACALWVSTGRFRRAVPVLAGLVVAFATFTEIAYIVVDQAVRLPAPGTSAMLILIGSALLTTHTRALRLAQAMSLVVLFYCLLTLIGYLYQVAKLYLVSPGIGTSVPTSIALIALALGTLSLRKDVGLLSLLRGDTAGAQSVRRLIPLVIAVPVATGALIIEGMRLEWYGSPFAISLTVIVCIGAFGAAVCISAFALDRAERRRLDAEGRYRDTVEAASRAKSDFLAALSHELRSPLMAILYALEVMKLRGACNTEQYGVIKRQTQYISHLVDDLLDVFRVEQGKMNLRMEAVHVRDAAAKAIEMVEPLIERRGHKLHVDLPAADLCVQADPVRLSQVIGNLLTNAARYTENGGDIRLSLRSDGGQIVIRVEDNGRGIAPDLLPTIFDAYVQGRTPHGRDEGLGIGLMLVKKLVELHGGSVRATSAGPGKGAEFEVCLPLCAAGSVDKKIEVT